MDMHQQNVFIQLKIPQKNKVNEMELFEFNENQPILNIKYVKYIMNKLYNLMSNAVM